MKLICYTVGGNAPDLKPASASRDWMDETPERFAYRCLPLAIANAAGWVIPNPSTFSAVWHGSPDVDSVRIKSEDDSEPMAISHFGSGVLTFRVPGVFRTEPGLMLWVGGAPNHVKDAIQPLTGLVETSWSPYTFTMNWKFTRAGQRVWFEKGEPVCFVYPIDPDLIETAQPEFRSIDEDRELAANHAEWSESRRTFNRDLKDPGSEARKRKWQKDYHQGRKPDGTKPEVRHRTRMRVKKFRTVS